VDKSPLSVTQHSAAAHEDARPPAGGEVQPVFYYDLASPESYLAAERVMADLPVVPEWVPVDARGLAGAPGDPAERRAAVEARAAEQHVQPLRWPAAWPNTDARPALIAATYAKQIGRAVAFSLAAFRQAFAGGRDLGHESTVLIAGAACEMHPNAVLRALQRDSIAAALDQATADARTAGVHSVPAIRVGRKVFHGERGLDDAAVALAQALTASAPRP